MDLCLEACDWSFASVLAHLPASALPEGAAEDADLPYSYKLPGDFLMMQELDEPGARWRRDRDLLRANVAAPLRVRYTARITDETALPAIFRTAVAYQLAALLAPRWIATRTKVADLQTMAAQTLRQAMARDRGQASPARYDGRDEPFDYWDEMAVR